MRRTGGPQHTHRRARLAQVALAALLLLPLVPVWRALQPDPQVRTVWGNAGAIPILPAPEAVRQAAPFVPRRLPSLSLEIATNPDPVAVGVPVTVTITVINGSPYPATALAVTLPVPAGAIPAADPDLASPTAGWRWAGRTLAGNARATYTATMTVPTYPADGALVVEPVATAAGLPFPLPRTGGAIVSPPAAAMQGRVAFAPGTRATLAAADGAVTVRVPERAAAGPLTLQVDRRPTGGEVASPVRHPGGRRGFESFFLTATDSAGARVTRFAAPVTVEARYTAAQLRALGIAERDLTLFWWDANAPARAPKGQVIKGRWVSLPTTVDPKTRIARADVAHFSEFVIGDGSKPSDAFIPSLDGWEVSGLTGAATYAYGIPVPTGAGGVRPNLTLAYNSGQTDGKTGERRYHQAGWVGKGWSLDPGRIAKRDTAFQGFDGTYTLILNGKSYNLVPQGTLPTEGLQFDPTFYQWRVADEDFMRVEVRRNGDATEERGGVYFGGPFSRYAWTLWAKDGTRYDFDEDAWWGFQQCGDGQSTAWMDPYLFMLSKVTDTNGNAITYRYDRDRGRERRSGACTNPAFDIRGTIDTEMLLKEVVWGKDDRHRVRFQTGERPYDTNVADSPNALFGVPLRQTRQLDLITVESKSGGDYEQVAAYNLVYDFASSPVTADNRDDPDRKLTLVEIKARGSDNGALPTIKFDYQHDRDNGGWNRLREADNGQGGKVSFEYATAGGGDLGNYRRVTRKTIGDGIGGSEEVRYEYGGAGLNDEPSSAAIYMNRHWGGDRDRFLVVKEHDEFRGHEWSREIRRPGTAQERKTTRWFYRGYPEDNGNGTCTPSASGTNLADYNNDGCFARMRTHEFLKGHAYKVEVEASGIGLVSRTTHTYAVDFNGGDDYGPLPDQGVWHAWARQTERTETYFEGQGAGTQHRTTYDYDDRGNVTATKEYDQGNALYRQTERQYAAREEGGGNYLVNRVAQVETKNGGGTVLARTQIPAYRSKCGGGPTSDAAEVRAFYDIGAGKYAKTAYEYDCYGNRDQVTTYTGENGTGQARTSVTQYDDTFKALPRKVFSPTVGGIQLVEEAEYNPRMGTITAVIDANGTRTEARYDQFGRLAVVWNPDDSENLPTLRMTYYDYASPTQPAGLATTQRLRSGTTDARPTWRYYDGRGRRVQTRRYGANGQFVEANTLYKDSTGVVRAGQAHAVPANGAFAPINEGDAANRWTTAETDGMGRTTKVTLPDGTASSAAYARTAGGGLTRTVDAKGHQTEGERDVWGRAVATREYTGVFPNTTLYATTVAEYDPLDRATKTRDALLAETATTYDAVGRVLTVTDPDRGLSLREYDAVGNLTKATDARGKVVNYQYDALDRLTGTYGDLVSTYVYDADPANANQPYARGRLTTTYTGSTTAPSVKARILYDRRGRVTRGEQTILGITAASDATYDDAGQLLTSTLPGGEAVTYRYDLDGSPLTACSSLPGGVCYVGGGSGGVSDPTYNARGQLTGRVLGNGLFEGRTYDDALGRLVRQQVGTAAPTMAASDRADRSYAYDLVGNVQTQVNNGTGEGQTYEYDERDRLTRASTNLAMGSPGAYNETYAYDRVGNFETKAGVTYTYDTTGPRHAVKTVGGAAYTYDAVGNVLTGGGRTYEWNAQGLPSKVTSGSGGPGMPAPTPVPGQVPNLTNNRGGATVPGAPALTSNRGGATVPGVPNLTAPFRPGGTGSTAVVEEYTYDAGGERATRTHDGVTTRYFGGYEEDSDGTKRWFYGVAQREKRMGQSGDGTVVYLHGDHLGSASTVTDAAKAVVSRTEYDPWGKERGNGSGVKPTTIDFTGQRKDGTGLLYYGARYYDPVLGRFLSADTVRDGVNPYSYVHNNPLRFTDPTGHECDGCNTGDTGTESQPPITQAEINQYSGGYRDGGYDPMGGGEGGTSGGCVADPSCAALAVATGFFDADPVSAFSLVNGILQYTFGFGLDDLAGSLVNAIPALDESGIRVPPTTGGGIRIGTGGRLGTLGTLVGLAAACIEAGLCDGTKPSTLLPPDGSGTSLNITPTPQRGSLVRIQLQQTVNNQQLYEDSRTPGAVPPRTYVTERQGYIALDELLNTLISSGNLSQRELTEINAAQYNARGFIGRCAAGGGCGPMGFQASFEAGDTGYRFDIQAFAPGQFRR